MAKGPLVITQSVVKTPMLIVITWKWTGYHKHALPDDKKYSIPGRNTGMFWTTYHPPARHIWSARHARNVRHWILVWSPTATDRSVCAINKSSASSGYHTQKARCYQSPTWWHSGAAAKTTRWRTTSSRLPVAVLREHGSGRRTSLLIWSIGIQHDQAQGLVQRSRCWGSCTTRPDAQHAPGMDQWQKQFNQEGSIRSCEK